MAAIVLLLLVVLIALGAVVPSVAGGWTELVPENFPEGAGAGLAVSLSDDGNTALLGAPYYSNNANVGSAVVFLANPFGWSQQAQLSDPMWTSGSMAGTSVALSGDGNTAAVGAPFPGSPTDGSVSVFTRTGQTWNLHSRPGPVGSVPTSSFGYSVTLSADGTVLMVGSPTIFGNPTVGVPSVYIYTRPHGGLKWTSSQAINTGTFPLLYPNFGSSVALAPGGGFGVVGAYPWSDNGAGWAVILAKDDAGVWSVEAELQSPKAAVGDDFGQSVSIASDNATVVVSAPTNGVAGFSGSTFVFARDGNGSWSEVAALVAPAGIFGFGLYATLSGDGSTILAPGLNTSATPNEWSVFRFSRGRDSSDWNPTATWTKDRAFATGSVALNLDGWVALIGCPNGDLSPGGAEVITSVPGTD